MKSTHRFHRTPRTFILSLALLLFTHLLFGQEFQLVLPDTLKVTEQTEPLYTSEVIYSYLTTQYEATSEKYDLAYFEWEPETLCSFSQNFERDIQYHIRECEEAGGSRIRLQFPKMKRTSIKRWIEAIHALTKQDWEHYAWKENDSRFEPIESEPGCYYTIKDTEEATSVMVYCGC